jgi:DNA-directed RNA polymerase alpha subunit
MESKLHKSLKRKFAGKKGKSEVKSKGRKRIDYQNKREIGEIERSGRIKEALKRLKTKKTLTKVLRVPQKDLKKAENLAKKSRIKVRITNLKGSKSKIVKS